ncbi:unnamed protein product [Sphagnum tenellum]
MYASLDEAYSDLGHLSSEQLRKGQSLNPSSIYNFRQVSGRVFYKAIRHVAANDIAKMNKGLPSKGLHTLSVYKPQEYADMKCFLGINNSSGFAIHGDELVSVFSSGEPSGNAILVAAIDKGARKLDCFATRDKHGKISGPLFRLYSNHGFHIDTSMNSGIPGEAYAIQNGVSDYVDDEGNVHPDDPRVVIFMRR